MHMPTRASLSKLGVLAILLYVAAACSALSELATSPSDPSGGSSQNACVGAGLSAGAGKYFGPGALSGSTLCTQASARNAVRLMLERTPGPWYIPPDGNSSAAQAPSVTGTDFGGGPCLRDQYVAAAAIDAFGAEVYSRQLKTSVAAGYASDLMTNLRSAYNLCGSGPVIGGGSTCATLRYVSCSDLATMLS